MNPLSFTLWNDLERFEWGDYSVRTGSYKGRQAAYLEQAGSAVFLREDITFPCYRLQAEVAIPGEIGFVGLLFGAKDACNYELVYLAPIEIQYDPVMNGSMTWQIHNGPKYQKPLPNTTGKWVNFAVEVQPEGARVYMGEDSAPQLVIPNLQHGVPAGRIGFWGFAPCYIRNLVFEEIQPAPIPRRETDLKQLSADTFVTEWMVSATTGDDWNKAVVEENGILNFNRRFTAKQGSVVRARSTFHLAEEAESYITLSFSDQVRLWVNEEEVYQGTWCWNPPVSDGRIYSDYARVPVQWKAGMNTIRAEVMNTEQFGWGLCVRTGLSNMDYITEEAE
ncbi:hypothetical protein MKZ07_08350 [Paenibacillus sp. FSL P4-0338]|uniref:hypothetical protein n=1 Tax=Paenibacillus sp. FSL P4-0338 TaxID=2921635 RepID=UPI0030F9BDE2